MRRSTIAFLCSCGCATADYEFSPPIDGVRGSPVAIVNTEHIDFGEARAGDARVWPLVLVNAGDAKLFVDHVQLRGSPAFELEGTFPETLEPMQRAELLVRYSPVDALDLGWVEIHSDDDFTPVLTVDLAGGRLDPRARLTPSRLELSCGQTGSFELSNAGSARLDISSIETSDGMWLNATVPGSLEPSRTVTVRIDGDKSLEGAHGTLTVNSNDPLGPAVGEIVYLPAELGEVTDEWLQTEDAADIIVFTDRSGSMADDIARLSNSFGTFASALSMVVADWQVAVVNRGNGCHTGAYLTPDTPDLAGSVDQYLFAPVSIGAYTEAGLQVLRLAVERSGPTECNAGMLRPNTPRLAILVSDEPDQSPSAWDAQLDAIQAIADPIRILAVVIDSPTSNGGYVQAADATGGATIDLTDSNWGDELADHVNLADGHLDVFALSETPIGDLDVRVDGSPVSGWAWDSATNEVRFAVGQVPPPGSVVSVTYPIIECED